ncbi:DUF1415 domain-containing protein [Thiomicrorhabdus sediminis]|uniref:DUF1415 domain-containing protein n=1 Tax=Thiomicrorhabdus sediminis TaxID=2580412 RepID=A0A4P9K5H5_9GAMM|nr:DUF1415 domain-containing protein [Thiomicrorhabdus sediminis]QCU89720.1 DUF1415 domain-containing protein [Thiomicrorhabdus sediminis]
MNNLTTEQHQHIEKQISSWLQQVVIGLNLCPFAKHPFQNHQVRISISDCETPNCLLENLAEEIETLRNTPVTELETTVLVVANMLDDFYDYNDFLDLADRLLEQYDAIGEFQIASFHPHYQFAGTQPDDAENLTNRSPYPILHLIREASLEKALAHYPNPEQIPENNIHTVENLSLEQKKQLFDYLSNQ